MPSLRTRTFLAVTALTGLTLVACGFSLASESDSDPAARNDISSPAQVESPEVQPIATATPITSASFATPTEMAAEQILDAAKRSFHESDSYRVEISQTNTVGEEINSFSGTLEVGSKLYARGYRVTGSDESELLYVKGFSYSRPTNPPDHPWFALGRGRLEAVDALFTAINAVRNVEVIGETMVRGRDAIVLRGDFVDSWSGPPPSRGHEFEYVHSSTMTVDAVTMQPLIVSGSFERWTVDSANGEVMFILGWSSDAEIFDYGEVVFEADHPVNLVPTPQPPGDPPHPPTPTPSPTPAPAATSSEPN